MKRISSRQNPLVRRLIEAVRAHESEIVIEGPKQVADAIRAGWRPLLLAASSEGARDPDRAGVPADGDWIELTPEVFRAVSATKTSQGVIGLFERPEEDAGAILARRDSVAVALDAVQDPGNVGTIVRLAAAFDAAGVLLLEGCADPYGPKAIRASAGAILTTAVASITPEELVGAGVPLLATTMSGPQGDPPAAGAVLLFGNEGRGVSQGLLRHAKPLAIPMSANVESLNVASSAAILLARSFALRRGTSR